MIFLSATPQSPEAIHGSEESSETGKSAPSRRCNRVCLSPRSFPITHPMTATRETPCGPLSIQLLPERWSRADQISTSIPTLSSSRCREPTATWGEILCRVHRWRKRMCRRQRNSCSRNVYTCNSGPRFSICSITPTSTLPTRWYTQRQPEGHRRQRQLLRRLLPVHGRYNLV